VLLLSRSSECTSYQRLSPARSLCEDFNTIDSPPESIRFFRWFSLVPRDTKYASHSVHLVECVTLCADPKINYLYIDLSEPVEGFARFSAPNPSKAPFRKAACCSLPLRFKQAQYANGLFHSGPVHPLFVWADS